LTTTDLARSTGTWLWQDARMRRLVVVLGLTLVARHVQASHVAPSVDDNNRYLKLTPLGDRVRLAYTVFFGEVPGARMRPTLDRDRDGTVDETEAQAYGRTLGSEVASSLEVSVDGTTQLVAWSQIAVGMGSPSVAAGSFSVDLIGYLCLPSARGKHRIQLRDRFRLPRPGETEVRIEDSPGIKVEYARIGSLADPALDFKMVGPGGPLADDGLDLAFEAGDRAQVGGDGCRAVAASSGGGSRGWWIAGVIAVAGGVAAAVFLRRRGRGRGP
jgi:hypothetical protein